MWSWGQSLGSLPGEESTLIPVLAAPKPCKPCLSCLILNLTTVAHLYADRTCLPPPPFFRRGLQWLSALSDLCCRPRTRSWEYCRLHPRPRPGPACFLPRRLSFTSCHIILPGHRSVPTPAWFLEHSEHSRIFLDRLIFGALFWPGVWLALWNRHTFEATGRNEGLGHSDWRWRHQSHLGVGKQLFQIKYTLHMPGDALPLLFTE